jgi:hypothetical protein
MRRKRQTKREEDPVPMAGDRERVASTALRSGSGILLSCLLGATLLLLYLPLSQFPFVQDDWTILHEFTFRGTLSVLLDMFSPAGKFFYRPLGSLCCWLVYELFGLHPIGFHLVALLFLAVSSFLVVSVAGTLTGDRRVAWGSGFLFAAASNVHIDPQMWLAGVFDIGAGLFALLCIDSFIKKRFSISALWFTMALGFKESMAMLLFVLVTWTLLNGNDPSDQKPAIRTAFNRLKWHSVVFLAFVAAKITGVSVFALPGTHPYAVRLIGNNISANFQLLTIWGLQAVTPLKSFVFSENGALITLFVVTAGLVLVLFAGIRHSRKTGKEISRTLSYTLFILVWFLLMLFPLLTLVNHFSRYYLTAAFPPLVIGTMLVLKIALLDARRGARFILYATMALAAANVIDGTVSVYRRVGLGVLDGIHASSRDGDNHFIGKASIVREVWKPLLAVLPSVPPHSLLVLEGVGTGCFADKYGLQVWYGDSTLLLTSSVPEGPDSLGMLHATVAVEDPWNRPSKPPVITFPASRTIHVRYTQGGMELVRSGYRTE